MILAEVHGKLSRENENKEDILTSDVFSFLKYTDRKIFLRPFLKSLGLSVSDRDADLAEFYFWPSFADRTEPDLVIIVGNYYLLFEAKYHSGFGEETVVSKHQLLREIEGGIYESRNLDKEFKVVAVTADNYFRPEIYKKIPRQYRSCLIWRNWQSIALLVFQILQGGSPIPNETRLFAEDLYKLLLRKNLRSYEGTKVLGGLGRLSAFQGSVFFQADTAVYRGDFLGFLPALQSLQRIAPTPNTIFCSPGCRRYFSSVIFPCFTTSAADPLFFKEHSQHGKS